MSDVNQILSNIQGRLVAKKDKWNDFSKYNYRSAESILESLKPYLIEYKCSLRLDDEMQEVGGRVYVKATAILSDSEGNEVQASAYAREAVSRKGMDDSQLTGATSSYARKYALGGLFAIDDSADSDKLNITNDYSQPQQAQPPIISYKKVEEIKGKLMLLPKNRQDGFMAWLNKDYGLKDLGGVNESIFESVKTALDKAIAQEVETA